MINDNINIEDNIFSNLSLVLTKLSGASSGLGTNIASLAEYVTGSGTITLPANFTHILILMGGPGGGGGGANGTAYASGGGGSGAFVMAIRSKEELTGTTLSYSIGSGGVGGTAGNDGGYGADTTLTGSGITLTAGHGWGGHKGTSATRPIMGAGGTATTQLSKDIGINGTSGSSYSSGYPEQTYCTFFGIGKGGICGADSGAGNYDGVGGSPVFTNNNYLTSIGGSCSGGGGVGGYHSLTGGAGASGFIKIYYFYN